MANGPYRNRSGTLEQKKQKAEPKIAPSKQSMQQIMFDVVVEKINQNGFSLDPIQGSCMYRTSEGKKCAVGWLISDEEYKPEMEGSQVVNLVNRKVLPKRLLGKFVRGQYENLQLLIVIQCVHDSCALWSINKQGNIDEFNRRMKLAAARHGLDWNFKELKVGQESA